MGRNGLFKAYGLLLDGALDLLGVQRPRGKAKKMLHAALKEAHGIKDLSGIEPGLLSLYIDSIKAYFAVEHGVYIRGTNEPKSVQDMSLSQYLKFMNDPQGLIFDRLEDLYDLHSHRERKKFLCDITRTPHAAAVGNENRLMENIKEWLGTN